MNKTELIDAIAKKPEIAEAKVAKKDIAKVIDAMGGVIKETLAGGDKIQLVGFGTLAVKERAARTGRNPRTGETIQIAASKAPAFIAGKALKEAVKVKDEPKKARKKCKK